MKKKLIFIISIVCVLVQFSPVFAAGNKSVVIAPTRVILEGRSTASNVRLINPNDSSRKYRISLVAVRMDELGVRTIVDTPNEKEKHDIKLFRYSPRNVTIPPGGTQVVRIKALKAKDLPDGEYRAHLKVEPVPEDKNKTISDSNTSQENIGVKIDIVYHVSIPIFYRKGNSEVQAIPHSPVIKKSDKTSEYFVEFKLERKGLFSIFTDISLYYHPLKSGKVEKVGEILGVAGYTPVTSQMVQVPVSKEHANLLKDGKIEIKVVDREKGKQAVIGKEIYELK